MTMENNGLEELFFELLERWYSTELHLAQDWDTFDMDYTKLAEEDYKDYMRKYKELKKL